MSARATIRPSPFWAARPSRDDGKLLCGRPNCGAYLAEILADARLGRAPGARGEGVRFADEDGWVHDECRVADVDGHVYDAQHWHLTRHSGQQLRRNGHARLRRHLADPDSWPWSDRDLPNANLTDVVTCGSCRLVQVIPASLLDDISTRHREAERREYERLPGSTRRWVEESLTTRQRERWPQLAGLRFRYEDMPEAWVDRSWSWGWRDALIYVSGTQTDGTELPLFHLIYQGTADGRFLFLVDGVGSDDDRSSRLPDGSFDATPVEVLDQVCMIRFG